MVLHGHRMSAGWGRPVKPSPSSNLAPPSAPTSTMTSRFDASAGGSNSAKIIVQIPEDPVLKETIDALAFYVALEGEAFEISIRGPEHFLGIDPLPFLYENCSPSAIYYRWRTYAFVMGDDVLRWRETPYQIVPGGPWWTPPSCSAKTGHRSDSPDLEAVKKKVRELEEEERRRFEGLTGAQIERVKSERVDRVHALSRDNAEQLSSILLDLSISNNSVKEAMGFAFDHADAASEVIETIKSSLLAPGSAVSKVAKLYLLNDILHNSGSSVKHASNYRSAIQTCLPLLFENLNECYRGIGGRMSAKQVEDRVLGLLRVWEDWSIFSPAYLNGLEAAFMRNEADSHLIAERVEAYSQDSAVDADTIIRQARFEGVAVTSSDGRASSIALIQAKRKYAEEYASRKSSVVSIDERKTEDADVSGASAEVDGQPLEVSGSVDEDDIDGEPIGDEANDDDIDGRPLDDDDGDDIDGVPMAEEGGNIEFEDDIDGVPMD